MYWKEKSEEKTFEVTDEVIDLSFKIKCKSLPLDHAWALSHALTEAQPWLKGHKHIAIHLIHGAGSANGWIRPNNPENELLHLSRRARFTLRIHKAQLNLAESLNGLELNIDGHALLIESFKSQLLVPQETIFSRYVTTEAEFSEDDFLNSYAPQIEALGINIKKMMGGMQHNFQTPNGPLATRSLMLADLEKEESIILQQHGLGQQQLMGMGIFLPHKGISAVKETSESLPMMPE
ncbi:MAG: type I-MYXAN CRISPR-associated protein Cas6/Cmx6 [Arenicellales bacterium]